ADGVSDIRARRARSSASSTSWANCSSMIASSSRRARSRVATCVKRRSVRHEPTTPTLRRRRRDERHVRSRCNHGTHLECLLLHAPPPQEPAPMPSTAILTERLASLEASLPTIPAKVLHFQRVVAAKTYDNYAAAFGAVTESYKSFFDTAMTSSKTVTDQA